MTISINDLSVNDIISIKQRVAAGEFQHIIAADYGFNQGRVNEIVNSPKYAALVSGKRVGRKTMKKPFKQVLMFTHRP
jgi:hypothetical protein